MNIGFDFPYRILKILVYDFDFVMMAFLRMLFCSSFGVETESFVRKVNRRAKISFFVHFLILFR